VSEITYLTIKSDATRIAALLSGEVDFVQDVPVQDIERLEKTAGLRVNFGPENRTIFLGLNVGAPELQSSNVKGKNPFADKRVRQAINIADRREGSQRGVICGLAHPSGRCPRRPLSTATPKSSIGYPRSISSTRGRCSKRLAMPTASRSRSTARTTATSTTRASARR